MAGSSVLRVCCNDPRVIGAVPASVFRSGVICDGSYGCSSSGELRPRAAPIGGRLAGQHISARRLAVAGAAANGVGLLLLGAWTEQTPTLLRIAGLVVQGVGLGLFQLGYSDIVTAALPLRDRGVAGSLVLLTRTFGTVTSASVIFLVFEILNVKYGFLEGFRKTFQFAAMLAFAGAACSAFSARKSGHSRIS